MELSDYCFEVKKQLDCYLWGDHRLSPEESYMVYILDDILSRLQRRAINRELMERDCGVDSYDNS
jgi:hypothetical protein